MYFEDQMNGDGELSEIKSSHMQTMQLQISQKYIATVSLNGGDGQLEYSLENK